jgi:hypothetical protein
MGQGDRFVLSGFEVFVWDAKYQYYDDTFVVKNSTSLFGYGRNILCSLICKVLVELLNIPNSGYAPRNQTIS